MILVQLIPKSIAFLKELGQGSNNKQGKIEHATAFLLQRISVAVRGNATQAILVLGD